MTGFVRFIFLFIVRYGLRFKLAAGLGEPWCRDGGIPQGLSSEYCVVHCCSFMSPGVVILSL